MLDFIDIMALENQQPCLTLLCQGLNEDCHNCPCILIDRYYNFLFNPRCIILHTKCIMLQVHCISSNKDMVYISSPDWKSLAQSLHVL